VSDSTDVGAAGQSPMHGRELLQVSASAIDEARRAWRWYER